MQHSRALYETIVVTSRGIGSDQHNFVHTNTNSEPQILTQTQTLCMQQPNSRMLYETIVATSGGSDQHNYLFNKCQLRIKDKYYSQIQIRTYMSQDTVTEGSKETFQLSFELQPTHLMLCSVNKFPHKHKHQYKYLYLYSNTIVCMQQIT